MEDPLLIPRNHFRDPPSLRAAVFIAGVILVAVGLIVVSLHHELGQLTSLIVGLLLIIVGFSVAVIEVCASPNVICECKCERCTTRRNECDATLGV